MTDETFKKIVSVLRNYIGDSKYKGHVYCVGGCVRDLIMGNKIKDIDLVVDLPDGGINFAAFLSNKGVLKYLPVTYPTYGTAMFKLNEFPDEELEAVQTRKEQYKDKKSRNPETTFGTLQEDAFRRDLTINALYYNIETEEIIDPTEMGLNDIKKKIIRTTNKSDIIFNDDPLRMLRCLRFACRFGEGWTISKNTMTGIGKNAMRLSIITRERIQDELNKILLSPNPQKAFIPIIMYGMDKIIFKTSSDKHTIKWDSVNTFYQRYNKIRKPLEKEFKLSDLEWRIAIILITVDKALRLEILRNLRYSNLIIKNVLTVIDITERIINGELEETVASTRMAQYTFGKNFPDAICFANICKNGCALYYLLTCADLKERHLEMYDYKLPVNGQDVINVTGISAGKEVGEKLNELINIAAKYPDIDREGFLEYLKDGEKVLNKFKSF